MKKVIIIILILLAIGSIVVLKKTKSNCEKKTGICPCKMIEGSQTNQCKSTSSNRE